jgi:hypothetical protein
LIDSLLRSPNKACAVRQHPLQDDGQFSGNSDLGFRDAAAFGEMIATIVEGGIIMVKAIDETIWL